MKIKPLSKETINLISAGEVIENPSDVLKELIENSIDAGSTEITVNIKVAGTELLQIKDNGYGIDKEDLDICLDKYTTSKLEKIDDIYTISSFGFRGEALSSIDAISNLSIITSTIDDGKGYLLENKKVKEVTANKGTTITIKNIFYNLPVRKKFLKSNSIEFSKLYNIFLANVLVNPEITFKFSSEKKNVVFQKTTQENRYTQIFGRDIKSKAIPINIDNEFFKLKGIVGSPANPIYFPTNFLFINKRYVYSAQIFKAISDSYKDYLMIQQKPFFTLFLEFNPKTIDVNVHPKKKFVKLQNEILFLSELKRELTKILDESLGKTIATTNNTLKDFVSKPSFSSTFNKATTAPRGVFSSAQPVTQSQSFFDNSQSGGVELFEHKITRFIGQLHSTYIVCETDTGTLLIDQHAAAERINLEKNRDNLSNSFEKQNLISKQKLDYITESQKEILSEHKNTLNLLGFEYVNESDEYYMTAVPLFLNKYLDSNIFINLLSDMEKGTNDIAKLKDNLIKLRSCKESLKANKELTIPEQIDLIKKLNNCKDKGICAHGRPTIIYLSIKDIEKMFKRIV